MKKLSTQSYTQFFVRTTSFTCTIYYFLSVICVENPTGTVAPWGSRRQETTDRF